MMSRAGEATLLGVSLKMYFDHERTLEWCREVRAIAQQHTALLDGSVELFVLPSFASLGDVSALFAGGMVKVGAQDLFWEDSGAFTGEVSGVTLRQVGCEFVEIGHAERKRLFGETDETVARKVAAALRNGLTPVLCVGERQRMDADAAAQECLQTIASAMALSAGADARLVVAYEPEWAIGAAEPAPREHVRAVARRIRATLTDWAVEVDLLYGGSAGRGLLNGLGGDIDGLFLGRFAHDPGALASILDEAAERSRHPVDEVMR
jgi:triosephosphate isomerase